MEKLLKYGWPGNIRELQHMAEKAVIMGEGDMLHTEDFFMGSKVQKGSVQVETLNLEQLEKDAILKAIDKNGGNVSRAVKDLGISRRALYYKLRKYDI
jgi:transcriptional regulator of acetoin/glycerol metabolism